MYTLTEARKIADWVKTKEKAKKRTPCKCRNCGVEWTPIYTTVIVPGQYKTTCSLECTKQLQKKLGSTTLKQLHLDKTRMSEISSKGGRASAAIQVRRSKDEIKLFELCRTSFANVESNKVIADGWDADIVIEEFKLAILWNGPWHYKEMKHKNHSLAQVQQRDSIKKQVLSNNGYTVLIFEDRLYTPETAFKEILNLVRQIVK